MAGIFGDSKEDRAMERELNEYLDEQYRDEDESEDEEDDGPTELDRYERLEEIELNR